MIERVFRALFWLALIFAVTMASLPEPPLPVGLVSDKLMHIISFAVLAALIAPAYPRASLAALFLVLAAVGGMIELIQAIPDLGRTPSLSDWIADLVGVSVAFAVLSAFRRLRAEA